jgi:hypothetical protein
MSSERKERCCDKKQAWFGTQSRYWREGEGGSWRSYWTCGVLRQSITQHGLCFFLECRREIQTVTAKVDQKQFSFTLTNHTSRMHRGVCITSLLVCLHSMHRDSFTFFYLYILNHKQFLFLPFIFVCFEYS